MGAQNGTQPQSSSSTSYSTPGGRPLTTAEATLALGGQVNSAAGTVANYILAGLRDLAKEIARAADAGQDAEAVTKAGDKIAAAIDGVAAQLCRLADTAVVKEQLIGLFERLVVCREEELADDRKRAGR